MTDYTPTTKDVRGDFTAHSATYAGKPTSESGAEFDRWYANEIRKAKAEGARTERERLASLAESAHQAHDIAECAAPVEGETGRQSCIDQWVEICEEPDVWLRNLADDPDWLNANLFEAWDEGFNAGWAAAKAPDAFVNDPWGAKTPNPYTEES